MLSGPIPISARGSPAAMPASTSDSKSGSTFYAARANQEPPPQPFDLKAATEALHNKINMIRNVEMHFSVHEGSGDVLVTVTDATSGEVIREIPPSEVLDLAARMDEMIGLLFDQVG